jgi:hypothetical protein
MFSCNGVPRIEITFDLSKIDTSNLNQNVHLDKFFNFHVEIKF